MKPKTSTGVMAVRRSAISSGSDGVSKAKRNATISTVMTALAASPMPTATLGPPRVFLFFAVVLRHALALGGYCGSTGSPRTEQIERGHILRESLSLSLRNIDRGGLVMALAAQEWEQPSEDDDQ